MAASFSAADIRDLAYNPEAFMRQRLRRAEGGGFGDPQQWWRYRSLEAYHEAERSFEAIDAYLAEALKGGRGPTPWKVQELNVVRSLLLTGYEKRDRVSGLAYVDTMDTWRPAAVNWRGHQLSVPGGLLFASQGEPIARLIWTAKAFSLHRRGVTLVVAATLASLEHRLKEPPAIVEVCHLRDREWRRFPARDLRPLWPKLDALLSLAERRPVMPPAA